MKHGLSRKTATVVFSLILGFLGGCLEKTDSGSGLTGEPPAGGNAAPTISGAPQTAVAMGGNYSFTPSATDSDGDSLRFAITNCPDWATFSSVTGALSGQPSLADVGTFDGIQISVSDGVASASLPAFSITVSQVALGSMSLSWTPPQTNTDGTTLVDLAGYNIYYGNSPGNYQNRVRIDNPSISTYVVENLIPRNYYVVATSFNSAGVESPYSNMTVKVVE